MSLEERNMPTLYVRDVPDELYQKVKDRAQRRRRSLSAEVVTIIDQMIERDAAREASLEALERITERRRSYTPPPDAVDSLTMLREDRAR
jgi:antitoxin FitA